MLRVTTISEALRNAAADPMWADHCEVNKTTALKAATTIDVLTRLLAGYVDADEDTRHDGFDLIADDYPTKDESRKAEAVKLLRHLGIALKVAA